MSVSEICLLSKNPFFFNGNLFICLRITLEGVDIGSAFELDMSLNFFMFLIYANFRTYVLKILTQPHCVVLSVSNQPALTAHGLG